MISVLETLNSFHSDNNDEAGIEKSANHLARRQAELIDAPADKFALVLFDGEYMHRKFPIETPGDINLSHTVLESMANQLPDEVVKTARFFIDLASREVAREAIYAQAPESVATNVVYSGDINMSSWREKTASKSTAELKLIAGYNVKTASEVRRVAAILPNLAIAQADKAIAGVALMKKANELGVKIEDRKVARFSRTSIPLNFSTHVDFRKNAAPQALAPYYDELKKEASTASSSDEMIEALKCLELLDHYSGHTPAEGESRIMSKLASSTPSPLDLIFPEEEPIMEDQDFRDLLEYFGEQFVESYRNDPELALAALSPSEKAVLQGVIGGQHG